MKPLQRFVAKAAFRTQRIYHSLSYPVTLGVAALVLDDSRRVLLVKPSYKSGWYFPGGGVKRGETVYQAMERELSEETGLIAAIGPEQLRSVYYHTVDCKHDHVSLFIVDDWSGVPETNDPFEIEQVGFFSMDELPSNISSSTKRQLESFFEDRPLTCQW